MKIGELARLAHTPVETIRYYERAGLMPLGPRSDANYRIYSDQHLARLVFVRHCRALDMTLDEVRVLLRVKDAPDQGCEEVNAVLDAHIGHVATRIQDLQQLAGQLQQLRARCAEASLAAHCGILSGLSGETAAALPARPAHLAGAHGPALAGATKPQARHRVKPS